jgi:opacity protein-like surface antigen
MRIRPFAAFLLASLLVASAASAQERRNAVEGFGGLGLGSLTTPNTNFGGVISGSLTPNIQLLGEVGRLGNVLPSTTQTLFDLSPVGFSVSAFYAEGGVRLTRGSSAVRPYAEASGGIARLQPQVSGIGSGVQSVIADVGLRFLNRAAPIASVGGGVTFHAGAFVADVGYRHHQVFSDSWVQALALGGTLSTNEVRVGMGVRF